MKKANGEQGMTGRSALVFGRLVGVLAIVTALSCHKPQVIVTPTRGEMCKPSLNLKLDQCDLKAMLQENMGKLRTSVVWQRWGQENEPKVAVLPLDNQTSLHLESVLAALRGEIETSLVGASVASIIDQAQLPPKAGGLCDDPRVTADFVKRTGARYFVKGWVNGIDERSPEQHRISYHFFIQVLDAKTCAMLWQNSSEVQKSWG